MRIMPRGLQKYLFDLLDNRKARTGGQVMLKGFNALSWTFHEGFDAAVVQVPDIANNLMAGGRTLSEESKPHSLHIASD